MTNHVKITALTELGEKGLDMMRRECSTWIAKWSFKRLKTAVSFSTKEVIISNPAMEFCDSVKDQKFMKGINQIIEGFKKMGAVEGNDFTVQFVKE